MFVFSFLLGTDLVIDYIFHIFIPYIPYIYMYVCLSVNIYIYYTYKSFYCTTHTHTYINMPVLNKQLTCTFQLLIRPNTPVANGKCTYMWPVWISTMVDQTRPRRIYGWNNFRMPKDLGVFSWTSRCSVDQQNRGHKQRCFFFRAVYKHSKHENPLSKCDVCW